MDHRHDKPGVPRPVTVRFPVEPVEAAMEADAVDAHERTGNVAVRGPVFGAAVQSEEDWPRWRVVVPVTSGCPQQARDSLNSLLWFRAKDEARDKAERRALLAAVARLEREYVDELAVLKTRYRIVRAEEYAGTGRDGIELPRPTDPEPIVPDWEGPAQGPKVDADLVLDPDAPVTPTQAAEMLAMRELRYTGDRFPRDVRDESLRALDSYPDVVLLPATFTLVERSGEGWQPSSTPHATAHEVRRTLEFSLVWWEPRRRGHLTVETGRSDDARSLLTAGDLDPDVAAELAAYVEAADRLRGKPVNELEVLGTVYRVARTRRLLRWGPDGPETPRPSDVNSQEPGRLHPPLDEDGNILPDDGEED